MSWVPLKEPGKKEDSDGPVGGGGANPLPMREERKNLDKKNKKRGKEEKIRRAVEEHGWGQKNKQPIQELPSVHSGRAKRTGEKRMGGKFDAVHADIEFTSINGRGAFWGKGPRKK